MFHGHNSEDGPRWDSRSKNPRPPNSLPFESIKSNGLDAKTAADIKLLGQTIENYIQSIETEFKKVSATVSNQASSHDKAERTNDKESSTLPMETKETEGKVKTTIEEEKEMVLPSLDLSKENADYYCLAAHMLSPSSSGLYDELMALVKMEVLEIHSSGIPILTFDWRSKVDLILLDDMDNYWSSDADPDGRFCINYEMRDTLEDFWIKSDYGWSTADDPNDLVFDFDVIEEWRQAFGGTLEERANCTEGVGRFGL